MPGQRHWAQPQPSVWQRCRQAAQHTHISDQNGVDYTLLPAPANGADVSDGVITVAGSNQAPVASNDTYSITERLATTDPNLAVATGSGVLANDTDQDSDALTAIMASGPTHGTVDLNADGSFVYAPNPGYLGSDSFTYEATDGQANSNVATVSISVTPRLSIPTNLTVVAGNAVVVPVNIDNPNPPGSGGLMAATFAINYDPTVFTVSNADVQLGTVTSGWTLAANVNATKGQIGISVSSGTPITSTAGGSLVLITLHTQANAPLGSSAINLAATNSPGTTTVTTSLEAMNAPLSLQPQVTNASNDPGVDGIVKVTGTAISASSSDSGSSPVSLDADQRYIEALFQNVLGRSASTVELDGWVDFLHTQADGSLMAVTTAIEQSQEGLTHLVKSWYVELSGPSSCLR